MTDEKKFSDYVESISQERMDELVSLHAQHAHHVATIHDQHFLINPYLHQLTLLLNAFYNGSSEAESNVRFHKAPYYDTIIVSPYNEISLGENLAANYHRAQYDIVYGTIANTIFDVLGDARNTVGYVMLYSIRFSSAFDFELIAWHKDLWLDLAEHRPHHDLTHFAMSDVKASHPFKLYSDNADSASAALGGKFFDAIESLSHLDAKKQRPLDFSIKGNQLSIIVRTVENPFGLTPPQDASDAKHIRQDLTILNKHAEEVRGIIDKVMKVSGRA